MMVELEDYNDLALKYEETLEKYELCLEFVKSFKQRAYDAWKPVQMFRSDRQVEDDEVRRELLEAINDEAQAILKDCDEFEE